MMESQGAPAPLVRMFGWTMLSGMVAFLINAILKFWFDFPGATSVFSGGGLMAFVQVAVYGGAILLGLWHVLGTPYTSLRSEAARITTLNIFLVRAAFWAVLLVGLGDAMVSFLRVNNMLESMLGAELAGDMGRAEFRGLYFHTPLVLLGILIAAVTRSLGFIWLALLVVIAELLIVLSRFVFSYEQAFMADLVRFWYGALFLFASAYTLFEDGHVRVDLFYASMRRESKGRVNAWGAVLLGMLLCWTILILGFG